MCILFIITESDWVVFNFKSTLKEKMVKVLVGFLFAITDVATLQLNENYFRKQ